jgi:peroxin-3
VPTNTAITRAYTLIYVLGLLIMLTRIQLNLLGRRSYLSSVVALATGAAQVTISLENNDDDNLEQTYGSDFEVNRRYLTFSWWLLNRGWADIMQRVEKAVRQVFGHLSPRDLLSLDNFASLTKQTRTMVESGTKDQQGGANWLSFLLPPRGMEETVLRESGVLDEPAPVSPQVQSQPSSLPPPPTAAAATTTTTTTTTSSQAALRRLLDETADLIESPAFSQVLSKLLDAGFALLLDRRLAIDAFDVPAVPDAQHATSNRAVLLPKILSVLTRQAHAIGNGMPNEYLQEMEAVPDLEGFAAIVYSSNWESEMRDDGIMASAANDQVEKVPEPQHLRGQGGVLADAQASLESVWERVRPR